MNYEWINELRSPFSLSPDVEKMSLYPVVTTKNLVPVFCYHEKNKCTALVYVTKQDGIWVGSCEHKVGLAQVGDGGSGFYPGRKWGEFASKQAAEIYYCMVLLNDLLGRAAYSDRHKRLTKSAIINLKKHISNINVQLELFV